MSLVFFYDEDGSTRVSLDSESSIVVNMPSTVSKTSNMSGTSVSDEVHEDNITINVDGKVSYSKMPSRIDSLNPREFETAIQTARRNRRKFTLSARETASPIVSSYPDCVIANCTLTVDKYSDTITVSLMFEQIFVSDAATTSQIEAIPSEAAAPTANGSTNTGQSTSTDISKKESRSLALAFKEDTGKVITKVITSIFPPTTPVTGG